VALYLTSLACAERTVATIERALVAISQAHRLHGFESPREAPEVTEILQGIRRTIGVAPKQKDPVLVDTLRALVEPMRKEDPGDVRDRALLCLGFASGCRRPLGQRGSALHPRCRAVRRQRGGWHWAMRSQKAGG
jgi:site-specific recombinase XerD